MSPLLPLRSGLRALGRRLWALRVGTLTGQLGLLWLGLAAAIFLFDFLVEPSRVIRAPLSALLIGTGVVVLVRVAREAFRRQPTFVELALRLQRYHHIDSDLVAALQFEQPQARQWGSQELQAAVIARVAETGSQLNPAGIVSRRPLTVWLGTLLVVLAGVSLVVARYPQHARVFAARMLLSRDHYPTRTQIDYVLVNGQTAIAPDRHQSVRSAFGKPVTFEIRAGGELPAQGSVLVRQGKGAQARLDLKPIVESDGVINVQSALTAVREWQYEVSRGGDPTAMGDFATQRLAAIRRAQVELPELKPLLAAMGPLPNTRNLLQLESILTKASSQRTYRAELGQLVDSVTYQVYLGDAWTDPLTVQAIPLPVVDVSLDVAPPEYTRAGESAETATGSRQAAVIEGSRVTLRVRSSKPLQQANATIGSVDFQLRATSADNLAWELPAGTPLDSVVDAVGYTVQVTDQDGMQLPEPVQGFIRLKADRPPKIYADVTTRHVLPTARPNIWFGAVDDYGLASIKLYAQRIRGGDEGTTQIIEIPLQAHPRRIAPLLGSFPPERKAALDRQTVSTELRNDLEQLGVEVAADAQLSVQQQGQRWSLVNPADNQTFLLRLERGAVQVYRQFLIDLSSLDLRLDDQVRLELEATDFRGNQTGKSSKSEVVILNVTDERGVYAAMQESDQRTAQQLNDIIQRHLGIGGSP